MRSITLEIPDSANINDHEAAMLFAASLYEKGILTAGQAADVAGVTKRVFIESLGKYGVSVFNYPASDITRDVSLA